MAIPIIDLFAGPGGLGEGFTSILDMEGNRRFKIGLSIEMDPFAHQTLTLRSFFRQFRPDQIPEEYYAAIKGEISFDDLFSSFPVESDAAHEEAWNITLGVESSESVDRRISNALVGAENWVLIGGPPCQAYSLVGRSRNQGIDPEDPRVYLYREYYRILAVHNPPVFIMENVKGLLSAEVDESKIFQQILNDLRDPVKAFHLLNGNGTSELHCPGYRIYSLVETPDSFELDGQPVHRHGDYVIQAEDYGIPQTRHRVILLGIRNDVEDITPLTIHKTERTPVREVLAGLPSLRSGLSKEKDTLKSWKAKVKRIGQKQFSGKLSSAQLEVIKNALNSVEKCELNRGYEFIQDEKINIEFNPEWYLDHRIGGVCNHTTRSHIADDLLRYLFVSSYGQVYNRSPKLKDFPRSLLPAHKNVKEALKNNKFADRFRVQLADEPSKTITSHISKDGHYYIHPDGSQCRSLTVREAARIQTFPDNYFFRGPRTSQYTQVGNAVPPLLANKIANIVVDVINQIEIPGRDNEPRPEHEILEND